MESHNDYRTYSGRSTYCRSLCFLLGKAARDVFPGCRVTMRRPISKGYLCNLTKPDGGTTTEDDVRLVSGRMDELIRADLPFVSHEEPREKVIEVFREIGYSDKVKLFETSRDKTIVYHTLDGTPDYYYDTLLPSTGCIFLYKLEPYKGGMLLRIPDRHNPDTLAPFYEQPKTYEVFTEHNRWNQIMGLETVGDVNLACARGEASDLIQVAEALQEKKIVQIAEEIDRRIRECGLKIVLITGPTSSGKTTFCKRLCVQLKACGIHPISFSTDDYFVNRLETPKLPDGSFDFDNFETVDHRYLESDVLKLLQGELVDVPEYNFVTGLREFNGKKLSLLKGSVLLIEGIHALNPELIPHVDKSVQYKIFINTITSIALDDHNCIPTSDNRLLRRIVRDHLKGAFSAQATIQNWPNVRRNEVKWIYPFQENADILFNSSYLVEFAVLRRIAEKVLATVPSDSPESGEAVRLLKFLHHFSPVSDREIPATSLLRGFIGGSNQ